MGQPQRLAFAVVENMSGFMEDEIVEGPNIVGTSLDNARTATRKSPSSVDSGSDIEDDDESSAS